MQASKPHLLVLTAAGTLMGMLTLSAAAGPVELTDRPIYTAVSAPANVLLTPSVEFPTAISHAFPPATARATSANNFSETTAYQGYFDPNKCYLYDSTAQLFYPSGFVAGFTVSRTNPTNNYRCSGAWSGSFLNWATMTTIDIFRYVLTGGARLVDTPSAGANAATAPAPDFSAAADTVLLRSFVSSQGSKQNFADKVLLRGITSNYVRTADLTSYNSNADLVLTSHARGNSFETSGAAALKTFRVAVRVCVNQTHATLGTYLESNCKAYSDPKGSSPGVIYKPIGLMQDNAQSMRFGIFGYLNDGDLLRDGAVLRGPMHGITSYLDPATPEIAPTGVFYTDPFAVASAGTDPKKGVKAGDNITNSGVINYLNKFGNATNSYKTFDPVSEMFAEAVKYFKYDGTANTKGPTSSYYNITSGRATRMDGFPVIEEWTPPITKDYYCANNFILGIGDVNTHADRNLTGAATGSKEPPKPGDLDPEDAKKWTDTVGTLEGISGLGDTKMGSNESGHLIAGLSYYARTQDLRSDLKDRQTVQTFWVDVLEYSEYKHKNQYWLAAKYGGFKEPKDKENWQFDAGDTWLKSSTYNGNALPSNYYPAKDADDLSTGLRSAFNDIRDLLGTGAGVGLAAPALSVTAGENGIYQVQYNSDGWYGDVLAYQYNKVTKDADGNEVLDTTYKWSADQKLAQALTATNGPANRKVVTRNGNTTASFVRAELSAIQLAALGVDTAEQDRVINYLRGDASNEGAAEGQYRRRIFTDKSGAKVGALGDIVDSEAVYVGKPVAGYSDAHNPGYASFASSRQTRAPMVYVGANDGMVHAFTADLGATGGVETWAYIPSFLIPGPTGTPAVNGLKALTQQDYQHRYFVNSTPVVRDVDFARTANTGGALPTSPGTPDWRTILVGGLGKGGKGYYALDVTDPVGTGASVATVKTKVLWEFTDADMGYTFGKPLITKTRQWGWVVIVTSGYNNRKEPAVADSGKGWLYVLNAKTGALLAKVTTNAGNYETPSGLAQITGYTPNYADYTSDYVYGGDLLGNMWRFDLINATAQSGSTPPSIPVAKIAELGASQPITTAPQVEYDPSSLKKWVFFGTGALLHSSHLTTTTTQSLYSIRDGFHKVGAEWTSPIKPSSNDAGFPKITNLLNGVSSDTAVKGWYYDLSPGERVNIDPKANESVILFGSFLPDISDPYCNPGGKSRSYALDYATGKSKHYKLEGNSLVQVHYHESSTSLVKQQLVRVGLRNRVLGTDYKGKPKLVGSQLGGVGAPWIMNWRVVEPE